MSAATSAAVINNESSYSATYLTPFNAEHTAKYEWQQSNLLSILQNFFHDAYLSTNDASEPAKRTYLLRRARAHRLLNGHIEIGSMHKLADAGSSNSAMRSSSYASAAVYPDFDQYLQYLILEWDLNWVPKGIVLYSGFPRERGSNWDGGGRDWLCYNVGSSLETKWIRWLKLDAKGQSEFRLFEAGAKLLDDKQYDVLNYSWVRSCCTISEKLLKSAWQKSWSTWRQLTDPMCDHLTKVRQYIAVGAVLRVMRKAQCLSSHEYKLLRLRDEELIYMSVNPEFKILIFSMSWDESQWTVPLSFARKCLALLPEVVVPIHLDTGCDSLKVRVQIKNPDEEIEDLPFIYSQIRMHLQQKQRMQQGRPSTEPISQVSTINPPRPNLCYFKTDVLNPEKIPLGDAELALIAETFAALRLNLERIVREAYRLECLN